MVANAATYLQAQIIYHQLVMINHVTGAPHLELNNIGDVNADENSNRIEIDRGMLSFVKNPSELALVLGHELAHFYLHHTRSTIAHEYAADLQGSVFMQNAGYDKCLGAQLFKRFNSGPNPVDHPRDMDRVHALGCS